MLLLFSRYFSMMHHGTDFLLQPIFTRVASGSFHLVLLLVLVVSWVWEKAHVDHKEKGERNGFHNTGGFLFYKHGLGCSLATCVFNLVLCCLLSYFYWYENDGSKEVVGILDLALRTVAWAVVCAYLQSGNSSAQEPSFPSFLRICCWAYAFVSSCCLVIDFVIYEKHAFLPIIYLVSDISASISGLFLCYVGCSINHMIKLAPLEEALLNDNSCVRNSSNPSKTRGDENSSPYSDAGFFSFLTFSWITPLISLGNRKALDLEELPLLDINDSAYGAFPTFRNKLESECGSDRRVTTLKSAKALFLSTWQGILLSGLFAFLYTCASYVGPYLIDILAQYLNGEHKFKNDGCHTVP